MLNIISLFGCFGKVFFYCWYLDGCDARQKRTFFTLKVWTLAALWTLWWAKEFLQNQELHALYTKVTVIALTTSMRQIFQSSVWLGWETNQLPFQGNRRSICISIHNLNGFFGTRAWDTFRHIFVPWTSQSSEWSVFQCAQQDDICTKENWYTPHYWRDVNINTDAHTHLKQTQKFLCNATS